MKTTSVWKQKPNSILHTHSKIAHPEKQPYTVKKESLHKWYEFNIVVGAGKTRCVCVLSNIKES